MSTQSVPSQINYLGIDLGSTTVKYVLTDARGQALAKEYVRHHSMVRMSLKKCLEKLKEKVGDKSVRAVFTGSAALNLKRQLDADFVQEVIAGCAFLKKVDAKIDASVELGGEDSKIIYLSHGTELRMNEACAGGTGAFIDQMAYLLGTDAPGLDALAASAVRSYPMASRCGVFAKTDLVSLLNQGVSKADIAKSVFTAVAEQCIGGLSCGRQLTGSICFLGGPLSFLKNLRLAFEERLEKGGCTFVNIEDGQYAIAHGAALSAMADDAFNHEDNLVKYTVSLGSLIDSLDAKCTDESQIKSLPPLFESQEDYAAFKLRHASSKVLKQDLSLAKGPLYLGIDAGSTTVKGALINAEGALVYSFYTENGGAPLQKMLPAIKDLKGKLPTEAFIRSVCSTGYGAGLVKAALNGQFSEVETIAHQKAACKFDPKTSYVIDIGGQDMKCIRVENTLIKGMTLNEACSSGCGSFLETFAGQLNLSLPEFVKLALFSKAPCDLGTRCTVFMNSKVKQAQRDNVPTADIAAGLCLSIVRNALYKVLRIRDSRELGEHVVVQGGTFLNDAILRAFELQLNHEVIRPDIAGLAGAYGAALIALENTTASTPQLILEDSMLDPSTVVTKQSRCNGCTNHCTLTMNRFASGARHLSGNRCDFVLKGRKSLQGGDNFFSWKLKELFERPVTPDEHSLGEVGLVRALNTYEHYPYWHALFTALNIKVHLSDPSSAQMLSEAETTIPSQSLCYPAKLAHGHTVNLCRQGVKLIFMPCIPREAMQGDECVDSYACPIVGGYPEALKLNVQKRFPDVRIYTPFLDLTRDETVTEAVIGMFPGINRNKLKQAIAKAHQAFDEWHLKLKRKAEEVLKTSEANGQTLIVLAGRPYHADPFLNHGIPALISSMGAQVISEDAAAQLCSKVEKLDVINQWAFHSRLYRAASFCIATENAALVQLVSFGCGIDAITSEQIKKLLEKNQQLYTMLKIDEGDTIGAAVIRLKSLFGALKHLKHDGNECNCCNSGICASAAAEEQKLQNFLDVDKSKTIFVPQMAPLHFTLLTAALSSLGYKVKLLDTVSDEAIEMGLRYVNNDACYPATVVVGQFAHALISKQIDPNNSALLLAQTCGPCRATNYPALLKWTLKDLGFEQVPIVTLSGRRLDEETVNLKLGIKGLYRLMRALVLGDLLQKVYFHAKALELEKGSADKALNLASALCCSAVKTDNGRLFKKTVKEVVEIFAKIPLSTQALPKVGIVGEILLKYHPKANLGLMQKIIDDGVEPVLGDLSSFVLYCLNDPIYDASLLHGPRLPAFGAWFAASRLEAMRRTVIRTLSKSGLEALIPFRAYQDSLRGFVSHTQQAGEGWLLTAEMVDFLEHGIDNVLCVQPFACLPNHITGKGVMSAMRERYASANLCSIDFEGGTSQANVTNRLKLFLTQAKEKFYLKKVPSKMI